MATASAPPRILLLTHAQSYRSSPFREAAGRLGIECVLAMDMETELADTGKHGWGFPFADLERAVAKIQSVHNRKPFTALVALDDDGTFLAASASERLGLPHNRPEAALAARDKWVMRRKLAASGLNCPRFVRIAEGDSISDAAGRIGYPLVIKPLDRNGSQGVMRVDGEAELMAKVERLQAIMHPGSPSPAQSEFLMESYIPGAEVAVEAILVDSQLEILALFDKPDPLVGPFFEESIYVTPSRLPASAQRAIKDATLRATQALGLGFGPVHAELRLNAQGPWILEVAGRSIGGLCSNVLHFGEGESLESLILRHACGLPLPDLHAQRRARGVMMIPIPEAGVFSEVRGLAAARGVPGITAVDLTVREGQELKPLPEGNSYMGFIFAEGGSPAAVETALRRAHAWMAFRILPAIDLIPQS